MLRVLSCIIVLFFATQAATAREWGLWKDRGGQIVGSPAVAYWEAGQNQFETIAVRWAGTDELWVRTLGLKGGITSPDWHKAAEGPIASSPSCVQDFDNPGIICFAQGIDQGLWWIKLKNGQTGVWEPLGGLINEAPSAITSKITGPAVLVRGIDNALYAWGLEAGNVAGQFSRYGAALQTGPGCGRNRLDKQDFWNVFCYAGVDNDTYQFDNLYDALLTPPDKADEFLDLGPGSSDCILGTNCDRNWRKVSSEAMLMQPDVLMFNSNHIYLFYTGPNGDLLMRTWTKAEVEAGGDGWDKAKSVGGTMTSGPQCTFRGDQPDIDCVARGDNGAVWRVSFE